MQGKRNNISVESETAVDERIVRFIGRHRVMTLAAGSEGRLWCCNLFYAFLPPGTLGFEGGAFVFTSPATTEHASLFVKEPRVAGTVVLEAKTVGRLQGLQFQGTVCRADASAEWSAAARGAYLKRFPFAAVILSDLWLLRISRFKFTDNTLGFGTKLLWDAE